VLRGVVLPVRGAGRRQRRRASRLSRNPRDVNGSQDP
jgi:hypothetical protein